MKVITAEQGVTLCTTGQLVRDYGKPGFVANMSLSATVI
jgi:hypothetical protein